MADTNSIGEIVEALRTLPYVEKVVLMRSQRRIIVQYPRIRGGRIAFTYDAARRHLEEHAR